MRIALRVLLTSGFCMAILNPVDAQTPPSANNVAQAVPKTPKAVRLRRDAEAREATLKKANGAKLSGLAMAECRMYFRLTGDASTPVKALCADLATKSGELQRYYALQYNEYVQVILARGPEVASRVTQKCLQNANAPKGKADTFGLLTCLSLGHNRDTVKLAKGDGSAEDYAKFIKDVQTAPVFTPPAPTDTPEYRAKVRELVTKNCAAEATGYVQAICTGIVIHEAFKGDNAWGDNGEIAKHLKIVQDALVVASAVDVNTYVKAASLKVLHEIGLGEASARLVVEPTVILTQPLQDTLNAAHDILPCIPSPFSDC